MAPSPAGGRGRRGGGGGVVRGRGGGRGARGPQQGNSAVGPLASLTAEEVQTALDREIDNLANEDAAAATRAAAVVMALSTREEAHPLLPRAVPKLVHLLAHGNDMHCKRNACAALGAITSASHELLRTIVFADPSPVPFLVDSLTAEAGLRINAAHALSLLAQEPEGRAALADAEAAMGLIASLSVTNVIAEGSDSAGAGAGAAAAAAAQAEVSASTALRARCLEASVDALCTLAASYDEDGRRDLVEKGAVEAMAALLLPLPHPAESAAATPTHTHTPTQTQTRAQEQDQPDSDRTGHPAASSSSSPHESASSTSQTTPAAAPAAAAAAAAAAEAAQNELHLRTLLGIGMLLNSDPSGAQRLASVEGALARLPALARSSDADVLAVAADMLGTVARHPQLKEHLAQQLRASASARPNLEGIAVKQP